MYPNLIVFGMTLCKQTVDFEDLKGDSGEEKNDRKCHNHVCM